MKELPPNIDIRRGINALDQSVENQLREKSSEDLLGVLRVTRIKLGDFGIGMGPAMIIATGISQRDSAGHGEDKREISNSRYRKPTAMNCFMNVLGSNPHLKQLPEDQFSELADVISTIAMVDEEFLRRTNGKFTWGDWPGDLARDPRVARAEHAPFADDVKEILVDNKSRFSLAADA